MKYFVRVQNSVRPANKLQEYVLNQSKFWTNSLVDEDDLNDIKNQLNRAVVMGNSNHSKCKPLELRIGRPEGTHRVFYIGAPKNEYVLVAVVCDLVLYEHKKEVSHA